MRFSCRLSPRRDGLEAARLEWLNGQPRRRRREAKQVARSKAALDVQLAERHRRRGDVELGELGTAEREAGRALHREGQALELVAAGVEAHHAPPVPQRGPEIAAAVDGEPVWLADLVLKIDEHPTVADRPRVAVEAVGIDVPRR